MRFCGLCGTPLATLKAEEERKIATVMFVDVVGFTRLSEQLDVEEVEAFLDRFFAAVDRTVQAEGGVVNKMMGDAALVLFGAPKALEHHALHALRAAVRLREWARAEGVGLHFGLHTGEVLITLMGSGQARDFTVLGDTVNVAQRIQSLSGANEIFLSEITYRLVEDHVRGKFVGEVKVKNRTEPVRIFRVDGLVESVRPVWRWQLPFVGREREQTHLREVLQRPRVMVVVSGPAGVGKTRLVAEVLKDRPVRILRATPSREAAFLGPSGEEVFLAWLEATPEGVVWLEDFQWADSPSLTRLERVLLRLADRPLHLVVTTRPEGEELVRRLESTLTFLGVDVARINLKPLAPDAVERLLEEAELSPAERETILAHSGGIPLFVEVWLQAAREGQGMLPTRVESVFAHQVDRLPREEKDMLKRLSVLGTSFPREDLELVDVSPDAPALENLVVRGFLVREGEGFRFRHPLLRDVVWHSLLQRTRRELHGKVLTRLRGRGGRPESLAVHAFHAGAWDQTILHGVLGARALLNRGEPRRALELLQYVRRALENSPDPMRERECTLLEARALYGLGDREGAWKRVETLLADGDLPPALQERAALLGAELLGLFGKVEEGLALLDRHVPPVPRAPDQVTLTRAALLVEGGRIEEGRVLLEDLWRSEDQEEGVREEVAVELARVYAIAADLEGLETLVRQVLAEERSIRAQAYLLHWLAFARRMEGKVEEALNLHARALELAREHGIRESWPLFLLEYARTLRRAGRVKEAEEYLRRVIRMEAQDPKVALKARMELGAVLIYSQHRVEEGIHWWQETLEEARKTDPFTELALLHNLGVASFYVLGDLSKADTYLSACLHHPFIGEDVTIRHVTRIFLSVVRTLQGHTAAVPEDSMIWLEGVPSVVAHTTVSWVLGRELSHALSFPSPLTESTWERLLQELISQRQVRLLRLALWKALQSDNLPSSFLKGVYIRIVTASGLPDVYRKDIPFKVQRDPDRKSSTTTV